MRALVLGVALIGALGGVREVGTITTPTASPLDVQHNVRVFSVCDTSTGSLIYIAYDTAPRMAMAVVKDGCKIGLIRRRPVCRNKVGAVIPCPEAP